MAFPFSSKTSQAKVKFIGDMPITAFCQDQQFGKYHVRMRKMINFDFVAE